MSKVTNTGVITPIKTVAAGGGPIRSEKIAPVVVPAVKQGALSGATGQKKGAGKVRVKKERMHEVKKRVPSKGKAARDYNPITQKF
jgi:hypothetical protein